MEYFFYNTLREESTSFQMASSLSNVYSQIHQVDNAATELLLSRGQPLTAENKLAVLEELASRFSANQLEWFRSSSSLYWQRVSENPGDRRTEERLRLHARNSLKSHQQRGLQAKRRRRNAGA